MHSTLCTKNHAMGMESIYNKALMGAIITPYPPEHLTDVLFLNMQPPPDRNPLYAHGSVLYQLIIEHKGNLTASQASRNFFKDSGTKEVLLR